MLYILLEMFYSKFSQIMMFSGEWSPILDVLNFSMKSHTRCIKFFNEVQY